MISFFIIMGSALLITCLGVRYQKSSNKEKKGESMLNSIKFFMYIFLLSVLLLMSVFFTRMQPTLFSSLNEVARLILYFVMAIGNISIVWLVNDTFNRFRDIPIIRRTLLILLALISSVSISAIIFIYH